MINLELAKKLKNAGLEWEPQVGDFYIWGDEKWVVDVLEQKTAKILSPDAIFIPRLDQLLKEITDRWEWNWEIRLENDSPKHLLDSPVVILLQRPKKWHKPLNDSWVNSFTTNAKTPEDAAAEALLWVLERGALNEVY